MTIAEPVREPQAAVARAQVAGKEEPIGRPVVSFDASRGRRIRPGAKGGLAGLFHRLFGGRRS